MASYHLTAKGISRKQRSVVAAASYRAGQPLYDQRQQLDFDYSRREDVAHSEIRLPTAAPAWMTDREALWNAADQAEKRRDALTARELEVALPRELDTEAQAQLVRDFVDQEIVGRGLVADFAIHVSAAADGGEQPHAHVLFKDRPVDSDTETGFASKKNRDFATKHGIEALREQWAAHQNAALAAAGAAAQVDHRTLEAQRADAYEVHHQAVEAAMSEGRDPEEDPDCVAAEAAVIELDREPEPAAGPAVKHMAERGRPAAVWDEVQQARERRSTLHEIAREMREAAQRVRDRVEELAQQASAQATAQRFAQLIGLDQQQPSSVPGPEPEPDPAPEPADPAASEPPPKPRVPPASKVLAGTTVGHVIFGDPAPRSDPDPTPGPAEPRPGFTETPEPEWPRVELEPDARSGVEAVRSDEPIPDVEDEEPDTGPAPGM